MSGIKKNVLHVEDDPDMQNFIHAILEDIAVIQHAKNLDEAKAELAASNYDMILLDLTLPDGSGLDLLEIINNKQPPLPTVVFSSHEVTDNLPGVRRVFVKHRYNENELRDTVQALCDI